jgi:hypothetical protein
MNDHSVESHFEGRTPVVRAIYDTLLGIAGDFGPFAAVPKKTSIHLDRRSAFAGIQTRKECLILTVKSPVRQPMVFRDQTPFPGRDRRVHY